MIKSASVGADSANKKRNLHKTTSVRPTQAAPRNPDAVASAGADVGNPPAVGEPTPVSGLCAHTSAAAERAAAREF